MNVLAIGCHPDDMEISCSGTLAKCVKRGDKVTVCHVVHQQSPIQITHIVVGLLVSLLIQLRLIIAHRIQ